MKSFILLNILVSVCVEGKVMYPAQSLLSLSFSEGQSSPWPSPNSEDCCAWKVVGGVKYKLVDRSSEAWSYNCSSDCTYKTVDYDDETLYCFKPGALKSECHNEGGSWPPMTGKPTGSKPPTTGNPGNTGSPGGKCRSVCLCVSSTS